MTAARAGDGPAIRAKPRDSPIDRYGLDDSVVVESRKSGVGAPPRPAVNLRALNLMHDIVTGAKSVEEARDDHTKEFADFRRKKPTPYMERPRFSPVGGDAGDPGVRIPLGE